MRAYHMPSLPEMPLEHLHDQMNGITDLVQMKLKILYALDDNTNFLARSPNLINVKTARIPIPGQNDIMTLGVVSIRDVMDPVLNSSPEIFNDPAWDYSVYAKDVSEEDEPFVGHGLVSKILNDDFQQNEEVLIPGRVCENFSAFNRSKTLEIRLRFAKVKSPNHQQQVQTSQPQQSPQPLGQVQQIQQQQQQQVQQQQVQQQQQQHMSIQPKSIQPQQNQYQQRRQSTSQIRQKSNQRNNNKRKQDNSTDTEDEDEGSTNTFIPPKMINASSLPKMNRFVNNNPAPKAVRTQSLPVFENAMKPPENSFPLQNFPVQSIARRIYMADRMNEKFSNTNQLNETGSSPAEGAQLDVSKRFAPDFMKGASPNSRKNEPKRKSRKISNVSKSNSNNKKINDIPEEHHVYQSCFNCKTLDAKGWKWNESDDLSKRGLLCSTCYNYLKERGVMRPKKLFNKTATTTTTNTSSSTSNPTTSATISSVVGSKQHKKPLQIKQFSSSPGPEVSQQINSSTTPVDPLKIGLTTSSVYQDSSDPLNGFDDMVGSDFDFQFGPLTDIDPLPQTNQSLPLIEDKENIPPPQSQVSNPILIKKASKQSSFEKMLTKSFSGALPTTTGSPNEWMVDLFHNVQPTPKDTTPKDSPKEDSPKDIQTCNTLPCNEESPDDSKSSENQIIDRSETSRSSTESKDGPVPSSPFLSVQDDEISSPNSMNNQSYWGLISDETKLSSQNDELPSKNLNEQLIHEHDSVFQH